MFFKTTDFLADKTWIAVALVIVFVTTYAAIGRQLMVLVPEYRAAVEEMLKDRSGMDVQIDDIRGRWTIFTPVIELSKVSFIQPSTQQTAFSARKITLEIDVLSSLLVRGLRLRSVVINGFSAVIENDFFNQLDPDDGNGDQNLAASQHEIERKKENILKNKSLAKVILAQRKISLLDSTVTYRQPDKPDRVISHINAQLNNIAGNHKLSGKVQLGAERQLFKFSIAAKGLPLARDTEIEFYGHLYKGNVFSWLPEDIQQKANIKGVSLNGLLLDTELWATWSKGYLNNVVGKINADEVGLLAAEQAGKQENMPPIQHLSAFYSVEPLKLQSFTRGLKFAIADLEFQWAGFSWAKSDFFIDIDFESEIDPLKLVINASEIDLAPMVEFLRASNSLSPEQNQTVKALQPKGKFKSLSFDYNSLRQRKYLLNAELENMSLSEWRGIPGVSDLSVLLSMSNLSGHLQLNSRNTKIQSTEHLRQPITGVEIAGPLKWKITKKKNKQPDVLVESGILAVENSDVKGSALFSLYIPDDKNYSQLALVADVNHARAEKISTYLPPDLPSGVLTWLDKSLVSGGARGSIVYHGAIGKDFVTPYNHTLQSQVFLESVDIDYFPGQWPAIKQSTGSVFIDNGIVDFEVSSGKIFQAEASNIIGHVGPDKKNSFWQLNLSADIAGNTADGIKILQDSVLQKTLNHLADDWSGKGKLEAELDLLVPLDDAATDNSQVNLKVILKDSEINMSNYDLAFSDINGALNYSAQSGLTCSSLEASVFGNKASINMMPADPKGDVVFKALLDSKVEANTLYQWSKQPMLAFLKGETAYKAEIKVLSKAGQESFTELRVSSNLTGIEIKMPSVFYKSAEKVSPLLFNMKWQGENTYLFFGRQNVFNSMLMFSNDDLVKGDLVIGNKLASLPDDNRLYARGFIERISWPEWEQFFAALETEYQLQDDRENGIAQAQKNPQNQGKQDGLGDFLESIGLIELQTDYFNGFGLELQSVFAKISREGPAWVVNAKSKVLAGDIKIPDADEALDINLDYLHWPASPAASVVNIADYEPVIEDAPATFPAVKARIMDFKLGEKSFGSWKFVGYPQGQIYRIESLEVQMGDLLLRGQGKWVDGKPYSTTTLTGDMSTGNVGDLMKVWGYPATIESSSGYMSYNLSWPHSPLDFDTDYLRGNAQLKIKDGRFLEVEGAASAVRVLGILNFSNLGRRLRLNFTDLFKSGLSYDRIKGSLAIKDGNLTFRDFEITGPSTFIEAKGAINYISRGIDADLEVSLPFSDNLIPVITVVAGPLAGGGWFVADKLFGDKLDKAFRLEYKISNTIDDPKVQLKARR